MRGLLNSLGVIALRQIKARIRGGLIRPSTNKTGTTLVRSAKLINSLTYRGEGNQVLIGTNLAYARIQHEGGTIRPKSARFLAIPLCPAAAARKPRDFTDTFIAKGVIFQKQPGKAPLALYALKRSVTLPARPYLFLDESDREPLRALVISYFRTKLLAGAS